MAIYLYGLLDEETQTIPYIGVTYDPEKRRLVLRYEMQWYPRFKKTKWRMVILTWFETREEACQVQRRLVYEHPALINCKNIKGRQDGKFERI